MLKRTLFCILVTLFCVASLAADFSTIGGAYCFYTLARPGFSDYVAHQAGLNGAAFWGEDFGFFLEVMVGFTFSDNSNLPLDVTLAAYLGLGGVIRFNDSVSLFLAV